MGEFDKKPSGQTKDQSKQVVLMIVLAVAFVGLMGWQFMKPGPQVAQGAGGGAIAPVGDAVAEIPQTPDAVRAALLQDPTANLLRDITPAGAVISKRPANPFVMDESWRASMVRRVETPEIKAVPTAIVHETKPEVIVPKGVTSSEFKLGSIVRMGDRLSAIVNGHVVTAGMVVDGAKVLEIRQDRIVLQNAEFTDGPTTVVTLEPKLK